jgi:hypothetical protein
MLPMPRFFYHVCILARSGFLILLYDSLDPLPIVLPRSRLITRSGSLPLPAIRTFLECQRY